jgi:hypothetical protein
MTARTDNADLELAGEGATSPVYYTPEMVRAALSEAQRIFALLTLCREVELGFPLTAATTWYDMRTAHTDILVPLWVSYGGVKLRPRSLTDLDARYETWQCEAVTPSSYCFVGATALLAINPQPAADGTSITFIAATVPPALVSDTDVPLIPTEDHASLMDYAIPRLRATEGGNELLGELWRLDRFLDAVAAEGNYTRRRASAKRYDVQPFEMKRFNRAAFMAEVVKRGKRSGGQYSNNTG